VNRALLSSVAGAALASASGIGAPVHAQQPYTWTGAYVGLSGGGTWGRSNMVSGTDCTAAGTPPGYYCDMFTGAANGATIVANGTGTSSASSFIISGQSGRNWQSGSLVYGIESDVSAFRLSGSRQVSANYPVGHFPVGTGNTYTVSTSFKADWLTTFRGRFGWALSPNLLAYATGGLALTLLEVTNSFSDNVGLGATGGSTGSQLWAGWTAGGGLEWAMNTAWSVKAEYLYLKFGSASANSRILNPTPGLAGYSTTISSTGDLTAHVARVGLNYKF
jgi:outer membrane immunogenic protein